MSCRNDSYYLENHADGNCLFESLAQIFFHVNTENVEEYDTASERAAQERIPKLSARIRQTVCTFLRVVEQSGGLVPPNLDRGRDCDIFEAIFRNDGVDSNYIRRMERNGTYGTELELRAFKVIVDSSLRVESLTEAYIDARPHEIPAHDVNFICNIVDSKPGAQSDLDHFRLRRRSHGSIPPLSLFFDAEKRVLAAFNQ